MTLDQRILINSWYKFITLLIAISALSIAVLAIW